MISIWDAFRWQIGVFVARFLWAVVLFVLIALFLAWNEGWFRRRET